MLPVSRDAKAEVAAIADTKRQSENSDLSTNVEKRQPILKKQVRRLKQVSTAKLSTAPVSDSSFQEFPRTH
jgi:hypothetical protein